MCCVVQLQWLAIGVTTNNPDTGPLPQEWDDVSGSDQYWYVWISSVDCIANHNGQKKILPWKLADSAGNTFGLCLMATRALHLNHNGRDVGVVWKGLPTDRPLWGFVYINGWKVEANYIIPKGEAVTYEVVCGVMFVSCNICACYCHLLYFALHMAVV